MKFMLHVRLWVTTTVVCVLWHYRMMTVNVDDSN